MLNLQLSYPDASRIDSHFHFENAMKLVRSPFALAMQLGLSGWMRILIYLALDYIILPADLVHKILPHTQFTDLFSSFSTITLSLAIYIVPELKDVAKRVQN